MLIRPDMREDHLFVLRVWREPSSSSPDWRATIEHIASGKRLSSTDLKDVDDFIRLSLADAPGRPA
jgi:hypothetical protein